MGNSTGNTDKKATKIGKMIKQRKNAGIYRDKKGKATQEKITIQLEEINEKILAKQGRLKRYRQRLKQYRKNRNFENNKRKFYKQVGRDDAKTCQHPDTREAERFWSKTLQPREHTKKKKTNG